MNTRDEMTERLQPKQLKIMLFFDLDWFGIKTNPLKHFNKEQLDLAREKGFELLEILGLKEIIEIKKENIEIE